jgi:UDP-GlcNAc:undecaprenyl-phosphate GlcNAc-1-phosphate transferase
MSVIAEIRLDMVAFLVLAAVVSTALTPCSILLSHRIGAVDVPKDNRRMHTRPVPHLGGVALFVSFSVVVVAAREFVLERNEWAAASLPPAEKLTAVLIGGALMFALGLLDDIFNLNAKVKLAGQVVCAAAVFFLGVRIPSIAMFGWHFSDADAGGIVLSFLLTVLWIIAITNMINLIDGLDGLAAGVTGIAALAIAYAAYLNGLYATAFAMGVLAGASLGFLPFNFYPAKIFMGDAGALFLGFALASVSLIEPAKGATIMAMIAPVLVLGVPVFDIAFAVIRRKIRGKSVFSADKGHLHHQLARIGMGQRRSVLMLYGISGVMGMAAIVFSRGLYFESAALGIIAVLFILVLIWNWNNKD